MIDVDGSYLYRKRERLIADGIPVAPLGLPNVPLCGWKSVNKGNYKEIATKIPCVTSGLFIGFLFVWIVLKFSFTLHYRFGIFLFSRRDREHLWAWCISSVTERFQPLVLWSCVSH